MKSPHHSIPQHYVPRLTISRTVTLTMRASHPDRRSRPFLLRAMAALSLCLLLVNLTSCLSSRKTADGATPLAIISFIANPSAINPGSSATLAWSVTGASSLSLSGDSGATPVTANSVSVSPVATTTYTLTATDSFGHTITAPATVLVQPKPVIVSFAANPGTIGDGYPASTTLSWNVTGATSIILEPLGGTSIDVSGTNSLVVQPAATTTYTLVTNNAVGLGTSSSGVTVTVVHVPRPVISSFFAKPTAIGIGSSSTLGWSVANATSLALISTVNGAAQPIIDVAGKSSFTVTPTQTTVYALVAEVTTGAFSANVTSNPVTVSVTNCPAASISSFTATPVSTGSGTAVMLNATFTGGPSGDTGAGTIDNNVGVINSGQPVTTAPLTASTTFTLSVSNVSCSIDPTTAQVRVPVGNISVFAGASTSGYVDGPATTAAEFTNPNGVAIDPAGNVVVAEDTGYRAPNPDHFSRSTIRKITTDAGGKATVSTLAGDGSSAGQTGYVNGPAFNIVGGVPVVNALLNGPSAVAIDAAGNIYIADTNNNVIRMMQTDVSGNVTLSTLAGGPPGPNAECTTPPDPSNPQSQPCPIGNPAVAGIADGPAVAAQFFEPSGIAVDPVGRNAYVADTVNNLIRKITIAADGTATVSTIAGNRADLQPGHFDGAPATAQFDGPQGIAVDSDGNVYVADTGNQVIRKISAADGTVSTIAGVYTATSASNALGVGGYQDGPGATAQFHTPAGIAIDADGSIYVADQFNAAIRRIAPDSVLTVTTIAGGQAVDTAPVQPLPGYVQSPQSIALDPASQNLYFSGANSYRIFRAPY